MPGMPNMMGGMGNMMDPMSSMSGLFGGGGNKTGANSNANFFKTEKGKKREGEN